jgi:hypothetical protein
MDKNEFEIEFLSDEEVWAMLDNVVVTVGESIMSDESKPAVINPIKIQQMQFAYGVIKYLTKDSNVTVKYALHEPFNSMGSISVEGMSLTFTNSEWFSRAAEFASNTEVYPLANGKVRLTLTFHGLVKPIQ